MTSGKKLNCGKTLSFRPQVFRHFDHREKSLKVVPLRFLSRASFEMTMMFSRDFSVVPPLK